MDPKKIDWTGWLCITTCHQHLSWQVVPLEFYGVLQCRSTFPPLYPKAKLGKATSRITTSGILQPLAILAEGFLEITKNNFHMLSHSGLPLGLTKVKTTQKIKVVAP